MALPLASSDCLNSRHLEAELRETFDESLAIKSWQFVMPGKPKQVDWPPACVAACEREGIEVPDPRSTGTASSKGQGKGASSKGRGKATGTNSGKGKDANRVKGKGKTKSGAGRGTKGGGRKGGYA